MGWQHCCRLQGMNFVAGCLLLFMDEEDAFWCLTTIIEDLLPGYFSTTMVAPQVHAHSRASVGLDPHIQPCIVALCRLLPLWVKRREGGVITAALHSCLLAPKIMRCVSAFQHR